MRRWIFIIVIALGAWQYWSTREVSREPGVLADGAPMQSEEAGGPTPLVKAGYRIIPLQAFALEARVLGAEHYRFDRGSEIAPVDLVLGWGPMSDSRVLASIDISQSNRFYFWRAQAFPIPRREIEIHSANMHMIPANGDIEHALKQVRTGHVVRLSGYLVEVDADDGWHWRSSLSREDTGNGACELVWVEDLQVI